MDLDTVLARRGDSSEAPRTAPATIRIIARFAERTPQAILLLAFGDALLLQIAVLLGTAARVAFAGWFSIDIGPEAFIGLHAAVLLPPLGYAMAGLYPGYGRTGVERLRARVIVTALAFAAMILFDYVGQDGKWSRGILIVAAAMAVLVMPVWDAVARRWLCRLGWWGTPVAVLGPAERRAGVIDTLRDHPLLGWVPVAEGEWPTPGTDDHAEVDLAILVPPGTGIALPSLADELPYRRVVVVPDVTGIQSLWVSVRDMGTHLGLEMQRNLLVPGNRLVKRALDLTLTLLAAPIVLVLVALFAALVKVASPGPAFYIQTREGLEGRTFGMWKLRTMVPDADQRLAELIAASAEVRAEWERHMKLRHDPRIVPGVGAFMRRFSIDELPQFWNVLRGDMSLVGPRPLPHYHLAALDPVTYHMRRRVRPGVTGLWQVSGRSARGLAEQQHLDLYYVRNWSIWLDLHILARTVLAVLGGKGAW